MYHFLHVFITFDLTVLRHTISQNCSYWKLITYNTNFNVICLLDTFIYSSIPPNDEKLYMKWYKLIRADSPSNSKKSSVGIYYKEFLAVRSVEIKNLNECVVFEVSIENKRGCLDSLKHKLNNWLMILLIRTPFYTNYKCS